MRKNPPFGLILGVPADVNTKYVYGSGVGALNTSVRRAQKKRASFVCCSANVTTTPLVPTTYTVSYNGNGSTFGNVPGSSTYTNGATVTVSGNTGTLTRTGYTFAGWNTLNNTGPNYNPGDTFTISADVAFYAQWTPNPSETYTLTYNAGSGGSGTPPASTTSYSGAASVTILGNTGFIRAGREFGGWNTAGSGGGGIYYPPTSTLTMPYADTILYAQWYNSTTGTDYQVVYNGNASTSGTVPATVNYKSGQGVPISTNSGSLSNGSLTFYGWNTAANGLGTAYPITSNGFTMPAATVTLYAQWVNTSTQYTLTYFGNGNTGGTVPSPPTSYPSGASVSVLGPAPLAKSGFTFLGWNTAADGSGLNYSNNASIVMNSNKSLYAQWVGGVISKNCGIGSGGGAIMSSASRVLYRDNTNNTMTTIIEVQYSDSSGAPYGTGNGPVDFSHTGNMLNSFSRAVLSQVAGVYTINISYVTNWTGQNETQTGTLPLGATYWRPTGQTIQDVTVSNSPESFAFSTSPTPDGSVSVGGGCYTSMSGTSDATTVVNTSSQIIAFYITFSDGMTTRVAIGVQTRWSRPASMPLPYTYTLVYNRTRIELANGPTPVPITGTFTPTATTSVNSAV